MALIVWLAMDHADALMPKVAALALAIGLGTLVFFAAASLLRAFDFKEVKGLMRRRS
jgi:hypothetical protein